MIKPIFENKDYQSVNFSLEKLQDGEYENCLFTNCRLNELTLDNYRFSECQFINCDLSNASIIGTSFQDVRFISCKLLGLQFTACNTFLFSAYFEKCDLRLSSFHNLQLKHCHFSDCAMHEVDFSQADLSKSTFNNCDFHLAVFEQTNLQKLDLSTCYNFDIYPDINNVTKTIFASDQLIGLLRRHPIVVK